jgi:hypothetical protein
MFHNGPVQRLLKYRHAVRTSDAFGLTESRISEKRGGLSYEIQVQVLVVTRCRLSRRAVRGANSAARLGNRRPGSLRIRFLGVPRNGNQLTYDALRTSWSSVIIRTNETTSRAEHSHRRVGMSLQYWIHPEGVQPAREQKPEFTVGYKVHGEKRQ